MSDDSLVIKEFLVGVGYETDEAGMQQFLRDMEVSEDKIDNHAKAMIKRIRRFFKDKKDTEDKASKEEEKKQKAEEEAHKRRMDRLKGIGKFITGLAAATVTAASGIAIGVAKMSNELEKFYYLSRRTDSSPSSLIAANFAGTQIGLADGEQASAVDRLAALRRTQPGLDAYINSMGIATRGRSDVKILNDIVGALKRLKENGQYALAANIGQTMFGMDEQTLFKMIDGFDQMNKEQAAFDRYAKQSGLDLDDLTKKSHEFGEEFRTVKGHFEVLGDVILKRFMPYAEKVLQWADQAIDWFIKLDKKTDGTSTLIGTTLVAGITAFLGVSVLVPGAAAGMVKAIGGLIGALRALGVAALSNPWAMLITGLIALFAYLYFHQKEIDAYAATLIPKIKAAWTEFLNWLEGATGIQFKTLDQFGSKLLFAIKQGVHQVIDETKHYVLEAINWIIDKYNSVAGALGLPTLDRLTDHTETAQYNGTTSEQTAPAPRTGGSIWNPAVFGNDNKKDSSIRWGNAATDGMLRWAADVLQKAGNWTKAQAAGILGNLVGESGLNPNAYNPAGGGRGAYGIAQWRGPRLEAFRKWAGHDITQSNLQEQLQFVAFEMNGTEGRAGMALGRYANDPGAASQAVTHFYERPAANDEASVTARRAANAEAVFGRINNAPLTSPNSVMNGGTTVNQKTDIHVNGASDPANVANKVVNAQGQVNNDLARNYRAGAY